MHKLIAAVLVIIFVVFTLLLITGEILTISEGLNPVIAVIILFSHIILIILNKVLDKEIFREFEYAEKLKKIKESDIKK